MTGLTPSRAYGILALRVVTGFYFLWAGLDKLFTWVGGTEPFSAAGFLASWHRRHRRRQPSPKARSSTRPPPAVGRPGWQFRTAEHGRCAHPLRAGADRPWR